MLSRVTDEVWVSDKLYLSDGREMMDFELVVDVGGDPGPITDAVPYLYAYLDDVDEEPDPALLEGIVSASQQFGFPVLIRCKAGRQRSCLVAGLILRDLGYDGEKTVRLLRRARGEKALSYESFEALVRGR